MGSGKQGLTSVESGTESDEADELSKRLLSNGMLKTACARSLKWLLHPRFFLLLIDTHKLLSRDIRIVCC